MNADPFFDYPTGESPATVTTEPTVFLEALDDAGWATLLSFTEVRRFRPSEVIVEAGSTEGALLMVADGTVTTAPSGNSVSTRGSVLGAGSVLGELAFFDGSPEPHAVLAVTDVDLYVLTRERFEVLAAREPALSRMILFDLGRILTRRVRGGAEVAS